MTQNRINIMDEAAPLVSAPAEKPQVVYASVTERFVALLIDYGVVFIPAQLLCNLIFKLVNPQQMELWGIVSIFVGINLLFVLYETIFSCGDRVTLGKALLGLAVVKKDLSGPISFPRAFLRAVGYYISAVLFMGGFLFAFFEEYHRALHDFLGGSVVVQIRQKSWLERLSVRLIGSVLLVLFFWWRTPSILAAGHCCSSITSATHRNTCVRWPCWKKPTTIAMGIIRTICSAFRCSPATRCNSNAIRKKSWLRAALKLV